MPSIRFSASRLLKAMLSSDGIIDTDRAPVGVDNMNPITLANSYSIDCRLSSDKLKF